MIINSQHLIVMHTRNLKVFPFVIFLLTLLSLSSAAQNYYPEKGAEWVRKSPREMKIDDSELQKAIQFAKDNEYSGERNLAISILKSFDREPYHKIVGPTKERGGPAGLVIKNGYIIGEWGDLDRVEMTFSVTKSYLSTMAGLALDQGLIKNVDDKVVDYVWDGTFEGEHNGKISWDHLLTQSSDWSGSMFGTPDWADRPPREGGIDDWKYRKLNEPGTVFEYNDVRVNALAYSLLQVWRKPLPQILKDHLMDPIGASTTWRWFGYSTSWVDIDGLKMQSVSGGGHSGGGLFISTLDHARFGLLFSREGNWNGKQLISKEWVGQIQKSSQANASYGYMWWLNRGSRKWKGVEDESIYYAAGFGGNFIVIDKKNDLIIVTRWLEPNKIGEMVELVHNSLK